MTRNVLLLLCALFFSSGALGETNLTITHDNLNGIKPAGLAVAFLEPHEKGAVVTVYAASNSVISQFMRELNNLGVKNVQLVEVWQVTACGKRLARATMYVEGDSSKLAKKIPEQANISLMADGGTFQCTVPAKR